MSDIKRKILYIILFLAPVACISISLCIGRYHLSFIQVIKILFNIPLLDANTNTDIYHNIIWEIRLPRSALGALVGGALGISGAALQGLFKNPLVSPGILGVSSGARFWSSTCYPYLQFSLGRLSLRSWLRDTGGFSQLSYRQNL